MWLTSYTAKEENKKEKNLNDAIDINLYIKQFKLLLKDASNLFKRDYEVAYPNRVYHLFIIQVLIIESPCVEDVSTRIAQLYLKQFNLLLF